MTLFWILAATAVLIALALLAPTLLKRRKLEADYTTEVDISIARERMEEIIAEHNKGELSDEEFEQAKKDLQIVLAQDIGGKETGVVVRSPGETAGRVALMVMIVLLPALTLGLYQQLGSPDLIDPAKIDQAATKQDAHKNANPEEMPSVEEMIVRLEERLVKEPNNAEGWYMLGRTYMAMKNYQAATKAYGNVNALMPGEPEIMLSLADAMAMSKGGHLVGEPAELVFQTLKISPNDPTALWLAGSASSETGDSEAAVGYWRKASAVLADAPEMQAELAGLIAKEEQILGHPVAVEPAPVSTVVPLIQTTVTPEPGSATPATGLTVNVSLSQELADKVSAEDTVFIFAKATSGPPMPLAVSRKQVKDLPVTVILDDSMAMMPQLKLSNFEQVNVGARVSKTGQPVAQPGDWQSELQQVSLDQPGQISLIIGQQVN